MQNWFEIKNIDTVDSPALIFYKERIIENIQQLKKRVPNVDRLRPHVKTNKSAAVCTMMMNEGIYKFKCATIAEAEMLALINAKDVLLAYQPVGPKIKRLIELMQRFPATQFSCLVDNAATAKELSLKCDSRSLMLNIFIDLNVGMNRTGISTTKAFALFDEIYPLPGIRVRGLHMYDGHIVDSDINVRKQQCFAECEKVRVLKNMIFEKYHCELSIVAGGSPTFSLHAQNAEVECSPGTFIFWDWSYKTSYPDEPFELAALVVTRVVSIVSDTMITVDLGHKSIAAENPLPRVHFLNAPDAIPAGHSEEHMKLVVPDSSKFKIGDVLYGVPVHICPTVAMYERAMIVEHQSILDEWKITARDKRITI